jgi:hypothetical protein
MYNIITQETLKEFKVSVVFYEPYRLWVDMLISVDELC